MKKAFHDLRSNKKMLQYGIANGFGAFKPLIKKAEFFKVCPMCGAHLDPSEQCTCKTPASTDR